MKLIKRIPKNRPLSTQEHDYNLSLIEDEFKKNAGVKSTIYTVIGTGPITVDLNMGKNTKFVAISGVKNLLPRYKYYVSFELEASDHSDGLNKVISIKNVKITPYGSPRTDFIFSKVGIKGKIQMVTPSPDIPNLIDLDYKNQESLSFFTLPIAQFKSAGRLALKDLKIYDLQRPELVFDWEHTTHGRPWRNGKIYESSMFDRVDINGLEKINPLTISNALVYNTDKNTYQYTTFLDKGESQRLIIKTL